MATVIDRLVVELGLDPKAFAKGQKEAAAALVRTRQQAEKEAKGIEKAMDDAGAAFDRLARNALKLFALFTAGRGLTAFARDITNTDAALGRLATSIGRAPEVISAMSKAVERSGGDAQAAARSFQSWSEQVEQIRTTGDSSILPFLARLQAAGGKTIDLNKKNVDGLADLADNLKAVAEQQGIASATYYGKNLGFDEGTIALMVKGGAALRKAIEESEKLGIATRKDTTAAQELQTAYRTLTQEVESFGRTILTAVSPVLVQLLKDVQAIVRAIREWTQANVIPFLKEFADSMGIAGSETKTLVRFTEALFALWLGSKALAFLRVLGTMRLLLTGGRVAAGGAVAGSSGLLGAIIGGLAVGGTIGADRSVPNADKPGLQKHWDDEASGAASGGGSAIARAWRWAKRKMFGGGGAKAAVGGSSGAAVPESVPMTAAERNTLGLIMKHESGGQNTMNYVGKSQGLDPATPKGYTAQGYYQMLNSNWRKIAPLYGIKTPNAMASSMEDQTKVALHLLRNGGVGNWANYNPALRAALARGDTAPAGGAGNSGGPAGAMTDLSGQSNYRNGQLNSVNGFVFHHTAGRGAPGDVVNTLNQRGLGVHYVMDRDGKIFRTLPDGARGAHMRDAANFPGSANRGLSNANTMGMEVIAKDDRDVTAAQVAAGKRFADALKAKYPGIGIYGHGELNPGHKQATEGMSIVNAIRAGAPARRAPTEAGAVPGRSAWWNGSPNALASVGQAQAAQAAQASRISHDNRSNTTTTNSTRIGSLTVQTAATDGNGIMRDMEDALKRRSLAAAANYGQA